MFDFGNSTLCRAHGGKGNKYVEGKLLRNVKDAYYAAVEAFSFCRAT